MLRPTKMVMVKPTGTRPKTNYQALDFREKDVHAQCELFETDDEDNMNLYATTPVQCGHGSGTLTRKKGNTATKVKLEPQREEDSEDEGKVFKDGMDNINNINQSTDSVLLYNNEEDDNAYEEFDELEVMEYPLIVDRASGDISNWKIENAEPFDITVHFTGTIKENWDLKDNEEFWTNTFYTMARCELSIQHQT